MKALARWLVLVSLAGVLTGCYGGTIVTTRETIGSVTGRLEGRTQ